MVEKFKQLETNPIPPDICYEEIAGLSNEIRHKLNQVRPVSLGQASRISGITPAARSILMVYLKKKRISVAVYKNLLYRLRIA